MSLSLINPDVVYGKEYYDHMCDVPYDRDQPVWRNHFLTLARTLSKRFSPRTVLDVGCAKGFLVEHLRDLEIEAFGTDVSPYAISQVREDIRPFCRVANGKEPLEGWFDLITCIEVAEHMPEADACAMIGEMCLHTDQIIFSSSPDDTDEPTHINLHPAEYWIQQFRQHGFFPDRNFQPDFITPQSLRFLRCHKPAIQVGVFSNEPPNCAVALLRLAGTIRHLEQQNRMQLQWSTARNPQVDIERLLDNDLLVLHREFCNRHFCPQLIAAARQQCKPLVFELDDLLINVPKTNPNHKYCTSITPDVLDMLRQADFVTVTTDPLRRYLEEAEPQAKGKTYVLPNYINLDIWDGAVPPPEKTSEPFVIGWFGTATHDEDLAIIKPAIVQLARKYAGRVVFKFWGYLPKDLEGIPGVQLVRGSQPDLRLHARDVVNNRIDLALAPLLDHPFNHAKSDLKWLEYSICYIPAIYSTISPYTASVTHGRTGWLVDNRPELWVEAIELLLHDHALRRSIAIQAHDEVRRHRCVDTGAENWDALYRSFHVSGPKVRRDIGDEKQGYARLVSHLISKNRISEARYVLEKLLTTDPNDLVARRLHATLLMQDRHYTEAIKSFVMLLQKNPEDVELTLSLGACFFHLGDLETAESSFKRVLELDPYNTIALENLQVLAKDATIPQQNATSAFPKLALGDEAKKSQPGPLNIPTSESSVKCDSVLPSAPTPEKITTKIRIKVGVLTLDAVNTACAYLRWLSPLNYLHAKAKLELIPVSNIVGNRLEIDEKRLRQANIIIVQRGLAANIPFTKLREALRPDTKIVFELDDALTMLPENHQFFPYFESIRPRLEEYLRQADLVTVTTPKLGEIYAQFNPRIAVLPNAINHELWRSSAVQKHGGDRVKILFSGTLTHQHDLALVEKAIQRAINELADKVEFLFWGNVPASLRNYPQIKIAANFTPDYASYAHQLKSLDVDLALVPLELTPFNRAKSPIKWLEYSACKIPAIFTDIEAYNQNVEHEKTGWLVPNTTEAWFEAIRRFVLDRDLRERIADNAHQKVLAEHTLKQNAQRWLAAYEKALAFQSQRTVDASPKVTIVIPTFNNVPLTRQCLESVCKHKPQGKFEIIVVDNASTDGSIPFLRELEKNGRIRLIVNTENQGFGRACNQGAQAARGELVLFLNNDTQVTAGWIESMIAAAQRLNVGVVGAKLLYADNTIQHAGIGFINGIPDHPHRHKSASVPEVNQFQELDMVTGACFLIHRDLFMSLGGFDESYRNGVEDIDLCLRVRSAGRKVVYEPRAEVYHLEGSSAGRFDQVNANLKLFFSRWHHSFDKQMRFQVPKPRKIIAAARSILFAGNAGVGTSATISWEGSFLDHGSLSHVNRELVGALKAVSESQIKLVNNTNPVAPNASKLWPELAKDISNAATLDAAVTVRHAWPPSWTPPRQGKLVVIQPWEFGSLPQQWVTCSSQVDEFWVPSNYVRNCYIESDVSAEKVFVVPNGVDPEKFHPQVEPMKLATQKKFKFLFVGGTIGRKGPDLLLQAYLNQFTAADDVCLVIKDFGGNSFYRGQTFEAKIRAAQSQPNAPEILYLNEELAPDALPGLYTACNCLVLPYRGEGFGLPVLEAMACGLPVIVTAGGATDDFVRDVFAWRIPATRRSIGSQVGQMRLAGEGWVLEPDINFLGQFMREAFSDPVEARRRGQKASQYTRDAWSWKKAAAIASQRIQVLASGDGKMTQPTASIRVAKEAETKTKAQITLPPCALIGHLGETRELVRQKKYRAAWEAALAALGRRPFHPEACLQLAEIAQVVGDGHTAKICAKRARRMAPRWKPAKKFLNQGHKGNRRPDWLRLPAEIENPKAKPQRLSVCLITKNEEQFLGACLKSVRDVATQIVVVDTGSTDHTVEIAKEHGAEVYHFTWNDDFSAARNVALEHVTGDWVLVLDADEELSVESIENLQAAMNEDSVMAYRLAMVDDGHENEGLSYVPRLFRNAPALFYVGRIHEQVFSSVMARCEEWGLGNCLSDVKLVHHGYTQEITQDRNKIERNLRLLKQAVEELPGEPNLLMSLGFELARSGDLAEGIEWYREAFDKMSVQPPEIVPAELREVLLTQFSSHLSTLGLQEEIVQVLNSPLAKREPGLTATLHFSLGLAHLKLNQFDEAAKAMQQCIHKRHLTTLYLINPNIRTAAPEHCLANSLTELGDNSGAEAAFQAALARDHQDIVEFDYARFLVKQNRHVEALQLLHGMVAQSPDNQAAWRLGGEIALSRAEFLEVASDWTGEASLRHSEDTIIAAQHAEALMLSGDMDAACKVWLPLWETKRLPKALAALVLCELMGTASTYTSPEPFEEAQASQEFIAWYQRLIAMQAKAMALRVNDQTEALSQVLPKAAGILQAAFREAALAA